MYDLADTFTSEEILKVRVMLMFRLLYFSEKPWLAAILHTFTLAFVLHRI